MADTDSLDLDAIEKVVDLPYGLPKYLTRALIAHARSLESQLADSRRIAEILAHVLSQDDKLTKEAAALIGEWP